MSYIYNPASGGDDSETKYWGDPDTDGSWRMRVSGGELVVEKRIAGVWVEQFSFLQA